MSDFFYIDREQSSELFVVVRANADSFDSLQLTDFYISARDAMKSYESSAVLLDMRDVEIDVEPLEAVKGFNELKDSGWFDGIKIARLVSPGTFYHEFIAELVDKLGIPVRNFTDEHAAIEWLDTVIAEANTG